MSTEFTIFLVLAGLAILASLIFGPRIMKKGAKQNTSATTLSAANVSMQI